MIKKLKPRLHKTIPDDGLNDKQKKKRKERKRKLEIRRSKCQRVPCKEFDEHFDEHAETVHSETKLTSSHHCTNCTTMRPHDSERVIVMNIQHWLLPSSCIPSVYQQISPTPSSFGYKRFVDILTLGPVQTLRILALEFTTRCRREIPQSKNLSL